MKNTNIQKLTIASVLCAVAVVGSLFSFPVFGSKCAPIQHMVNIICAVMLGPGYGVAVAFCASLLRNLLGLGSLMAFPGSTIYLIDEEGLHLTPYEQTPHYQLTRSFLENPERMLGYLFQE